MEQTRLRAKGPADLLALAPYLLGFEPQESVVFMAMDQGSSVGAARIDLEALEEEPEIALHTWAVLTQRCPTAQLVLLGYSDSHERTVDALRRTATSVEQAVGALMVATVAFTDGHRWWFLDDEWEWSMDAGESYDPSPPAVLEAVLSGIHVVGTRETLVASVAGPTASQGRAFGRMIRAHEKKQRRWHDSDAAARALVLLDRALRAPAEPTEEEQAELVALVQWIPTRDACWMAMSRANAEEHQVLWHHLVRRTPDDWSAPLLAMLGFSAWVAGDGALANIACERGLSVTPHYSMLTLLDEVLRGGAHPSLWEQMHRRSPESDRWGAEQYCDDPCCSDPCCSDPCCGDDQRWGHPR